MTTTTGPSPQFSTSRRRASRGRELRANVALFVSCLVDLFRPTVGFAAVKLLEDAGCRVEVPEQTCCGQPAYNSGEREAARKVARGLIDRFEDFDHIVVPSGSCAGMLAHDLADLFVDMPDVAARARRLGAKVHELTSFLVDVLGVDHVGSAYDGIVTYHDSCSSLRAMKVADQPRRLLESVKGLTLREAADREVCCGFGGTFCVKYPAISTAMATDKAARLAETGADTVLAGDLGCLMNIAGLLKRQGSPIRVRHVAEVLAGMTDGPAIGEGKDARWSS
jgi:L-lactate dehydrogenase complex protein LldE